MTNSIKNVWNLSDDAFIKASASSKRYKYKHGMFAAIPIICQGKDCPYKPVCTIPEQHIVVNERCPVEIGAIMARFDMWCEHFDIDVSGDEIQTKDLVDATLIRDLVDIEVQILRAENKIAMTGDFIGLTISTVDRNGKPFYENTVTPEAEFKNSLYDRRYKILNLLNSTRKDKSKDEKVTNDAQKTLAIFNEIASVMNNKVDLSKKEGEESGESKVKF